MEGVLFKIKVDLGARNLEVLVLPPEGTWSNDSQLEINCFADCQKEAEEYLTRTKTAKSTAKLFNRSTEVNDPVYSSLITCVCNHMTKLCVDWWGKV